MKRLIALLLALGLTATLTACSGNTPAPDDTAVPDDVIPSPDITQAVTLAPDPTPEVTQAATPIPDKGTPPPDDPSQDVTILHPGDEGYVTPEPTPTAAVVATPAPSEAPAPTSEPTPEPAADPTAAEVYTAVSAVAGSANLSDMSAVMEHFYNLSSADVEDFVFYMPDMSASLEEIFIAKAKSGKVSTVKSACQSRLDGLREDAEFYPDTGAYLDTAKIETVGDWVILAVCANSAGAVKAFQDCVK